eukprot:2205106-Pyramimonas_sp.AAC.1
MVLRLWDMSILEPGLLPSACEALFLRPGPCPCHLCLFPSDTVSRGAESIHTSSTSRVVRLIRSGFLFGPCRTTCQRTPTVV